MLLYGSKLLDPLLIESVHVAPARCRPASYLRGEYQLSHLLKVGRPRNVEHKHHAVHLITAPANEANAHLAKDTAQVHTPRSPRCGAIGARCRGGRGACRLSARERPGMFNKSREKGAKR